MELFEFLTDTTAGKCLLTMLVSMVPIIELRGGLPFGVALGLPYYLAFPAAVIGNIIPAPFIIVYIRRVFQWMRRRLPSTMPVPRLLPISSQPLTKCTPLPPPKMLILMR